MGYTMGRLFTIASGSGEIDLKSRKALLSHIELSLDDVDVNLILSSFAVCIAKKIATTLELDRVRVYVKAVTDIRDLIDLAELSMRRLIVEIHIYKRESIDKERVIEAAKQCPSMDLIEDKVEDFTVILGIDNGK